MNKKTQNRKPVKKFVDALEILQNIDNCIIKTAFGDLDVENLTKNDLKKHGSIYVSLTNMPEFFSSKKFQSKTPSKPFQLALEHCEKTYKNVIPINSFISAELMGIQNHPYTKSDGVYVVLHGSIIAEVPNNMDYDNLEFLCETFITEGFVIVDKLGKRFKLKREYFPNIDNSSKQRGKFTEAPNISDYTDVGKQLCGNGKFGYHHATISNTEQTVIAQKNGFNLVIIPHSETIKKQLENNFDGEKMLGLLETIGSGDTYRYTENFNSSVTDCEYQLKFDGETVLLHKDELCENLHLMVKFQVNVHEIKQNDGSFKYRLGWL